MQHRAIKGVTSIARNVGGSDGSGGGIGMIDRRLF